MLLFQSKIEAYCAFTVNLGPLYVERVFDSVLTRQGIKDIVKMASVRRLNLYLQYLHEKSRYQSRNHFAFNQFYIGHFSHQLALHSKLTENNCHLKEKAICHYETYLDIAKDTAESRFYAQWQLAILQSQTGYHWRDIEKSLSKAVNLDNLRGEPLKELVAHYCYTKAWKKAYHLSRILVERHFEKSPSAVRRWFVDPTVYDWHIIQNHRTICQKIGAVQEADHWKQGQTQ